MVYSRRIQIIYILALFSSINILNGFYNSISGFLDRLLLVIWINLKRELNKMLVNACRTISHSNQFQFYLFNS